MAMSNDVATPPFYYELIEQSRQLGCRVLTVQPVVCAGPTKEIGRPSICVAGVRPASSRRLQLRELLVQGDSEHAPRFMPLKWPALLRGSERTVHENDGFARCGHRDWGRRWHSLLVVHASQHTVTWNREVIS